MAHPPNDGTPGHDGPEPGNAEVEPAERTEQDAAQEQGEDDDLRAATAGLAALASGRMSLPALLTRVAEFAVRAIPGADGAGLTLLEAGKADTIVATAEFVRAVDAIQYGLGEGPCILAAASGATVRSGALGSDPTWPRFGPRVSHLGVHSALSLPLVGSEGVLGAMNIYAHRPDAFDDRAAELGELYAVPAAISVQNAQVLAQALALAAQLETALRSRSVIDQAIGVLMARSGYNPAQAFARLRAMSQQENRRLAVIAQGIVEQAASRARAQHTDD
jgi:GAF domain-containing protein